MKIKIVWLDRNKKEYDLKDINDDYLVRIIRTISKWEYPYKYSNDLIREVQRRNLIDKCYEEIRILLIKMESGIESAYGFDNFTDDFC